MSRLAVFPIDHLNALSSRHLLPHLSLSAAEPPGAGSSTKRTKLASSRTRRCIKRSHRQWFMCLLFLFCWRDFFFVLAQRSSRHEYKWVNQFQTPQFVHRTAPTLLAWKPQVQIRPGERADRRAAPSLSSYRWGLRDAADRCWTESWSRVKLLGTNRQRTGWTSYALMFVRLNVCGSCRSSSLMISCQTRQDETFRV